MDGIADIVSPPSAEEIANWHSVGQYLIDRFQSGQFGPGGPSFQSDGNVQPDYQQLAYNTFGTMNDAGFGYGQAGGPAFDIPGTSLSSGTSNFAGGQTVDKFNPFDAFGTSNGGQLSTFGNDDGSFATLSGNDWSSLPSNTFTLTSTTLGLSGYDTGTTSVGYVDHTPVATPVFTPTITTASTPASTPVTSTPATQSYGGGGGGDGKGGGGDNYSTTTTADAHYNGSNDKGFSFGEHASIGFPVVLDLNGDGLNITPLSSSNMFYDMAGDGYQHRTAWAGVGRNRTKRTKSNVHAGSRAIVTSNAHFARGRRDGVAERFARPSKKVTPGAGLKLTEEAAG